VILKELARDREQITWRVLDDTGTPTNFTNLGSLASAIGELGMDLDEVDLSIASWGEELIVALDITP
jgi:hypothetical protein